MLEIVFFRTVFFYFFLLTVMRIMGKREIGGLSPLDLAVTIIMAELAAIPIANPELPLLVGIAPTITIMLLAIALSTLSLRSPRWRTIINGRPNIIIQDGKFVPKELRKVRFSISDVLEQLRRQGHYSIADVEVAIIETDGKLSVIPKSQARPLQPRDLHIPTEYEGLAYTLISDGEVDYAHLKACGLDMTWLNQQLKERGIASPNDVFSAILDTQGNLFVQLKENTNVYVQS